MRVAAAGAHTLDDVGIRMGLTRERVRQIEQLALWKLGKVLLQYGLLSKDELKRDEYIHLKRKILMHKDNKSIEEGGLIAI